MFNPLPTMNWALSAMETSMAAAATINARMTMLFSAAFTGSPRAVRELQRMVTEKADATMEGAMAAGTAALRAWLHATTSMSVLDMTAWSRVAEAAFAPARRAILANARRLA